MSWKWLQAHKPSAKALASAWVTLTAFWSFSKDFRDYIWAIYAALPHGLHQFLAGVIVPALVFWQTRRTARVVAEVEPGSEGAVKASAKVLPVVLLCLLLLPMLVGCAKQVNAALPVNAINSFDANAYRVIADARAAVNSVRESVAAGKVTLTQEQTSAYNQVIADTNTAMHLYKAYHAGATSDYADLNKAIDALVADLVKLKQTLGMENVSNNRYGHGVQLVYLVHGEPNDQSDYYAGVGGAHRSRFWRSNSDGGSNHCDFDQRGYPVAGGRAAVRRGIDRGGDCGACRAAGYTLCS